MMMKDTLEKDFYIEIKNKTDYVFIEALDVLKEFERKGYAASSWIGLTEIP